MSLTGHSTVAANDREDGIEKGNHSLESDIAAADEEQPVRPVHGLRWALICIAIYIATFLYGLDTTIAADVQSAVIETFGEVQQLAWLGVGFSLGSVATILPFSKAFERFDTKWNFLVGILLFECGSVLCGAAPTMAALIVGRVITGLGGSGIYLGALNYFTVFTSSTERGGYIAATGLCFGVGAVTGPVIGGAFSESSATWRWAFYINLVIAAVCAPIYAIMPSYKPNPNLSQSEHLRHLDWLGTILNIGMWVSFAILFTFGGTLWEWSSARTIATSVVFALVLIAFVAQQTFAICTTVATAASASSMFNPIYFIPVYFQFVHGDTAIQAAIRLLPFVTVSMGINLATGVFLPRVRIYALLYLVAGLLVVAGSVPLYQWRPETPIAQVYGLSALSAFGTGLSFQAAYTLAGIKLAAQNRADELPHAIALQNVAQVSGCGITLIIAGQVFQSTTISALTGVLQTYDLPMEKIRAAVAGSQSSAFQTLPAQGATAATLAITRAIANTWIMNSVAGAVLVLAALAMRWERLI